MSKCLIVAVAALVAFCSTSGVLGQSSPTPAQFYNDCASASKRCWGDTDICVQFRNCTYAAAIGENATHYNVILMNGCAEPKQKLKHFYVGMGFDTLDGEGRRICRDSRIDDFKAFILWDGENKCPLKTFAYELFWTSRSKTSAKQMCLYDEHTKGVQQPEGVFELGNYLRKYVIISAGDNAAPFQFADKVDYRYNDGLYRNRAPVTVEPADAKIPIRAINVTDPTLPENIPSGRPYHQDTGNSAGDLNGRSRRAVILVHGLLLTLMSYLML